MRFGRRVVGRGHGGARHLRWRRLGHAGGCGGACHISPLATAPLEQDDAEVQLRHQVMRRAGCTTGQLRVAHLWECVSPTWELSWLEQIRPPRCRRHLRPTQRHAAAQRGRTGTCVSSFSSFSTSTRSATLNRKGTLGRYPAAFDRGARTTTAAAFMRSPGGVTGSLRALSRASESEQGELASLHVTPMMRQQKPRIGEAGTRDARRQPKAARRSGSSGVYDTWASATHPRHQLLNESLNGSYVLCPPSSISFRLRSRRSW